MIGQLRWDERNVEQTARYHVQYWEVEEVLDDEPFFNRVREGRLEMMGQTAAGRFVTAFADHEGYDEYYVVTARESTRPERRRYAGRRGR